MSLTFARFIEASGARPLADVPARFVPSTDSRTLQAGETFVCLRGQNFDGHDHIAQAVSRGAVAVVADDRAKAVATVPVVVVDDVKAAYLAGAAAARKAYGGQVIAVTGSTGKTTTKEFVTQILGTRRRVLATPLNENNELGVAKVCFQMDERSEIAVLEFGARHPGEIAQLVAIAKPDIGILTNVGEAHLEFFRDQEELARTKFALVSGGARAVLSAADAWSRMLAAQAGIDAHAMWVRLVGDPTMNGIMLEAGVPSGGKVAVTMAASHAFAGWRLFGEHHLRDALAAAAAAILAGLTFEDALAPLGELRLPAGRFQSHHAPCGATVVYDAYNASPSSMQHALRSFGDMPARRHIAVLGSMAELGAQAPRYHEEVGAAAARSGADMLYAGGEFAQAIAQGARDAGMAAEQVTVFSDNASALESLRRLVVAGDCVLLKGSRIQRLEEILEGLVGAGSLAS